MTFAWPALLWLLALPLALLGAEIARRRRLGAVLRPKIVHAEAGARSLELVTRPSPPRRLRPWLCAGLALFIVALARPQWGHIDEPVFDQSREILIAIDLSRSMLSQDVKPSRLDRAKLLTQSLLEKLVGERVGLITFSGTAFLQSPLSSDYEILREFLPELNPDFLPEGGTNYHALIDTALDAFGSSNAADRFLIVLSDGEATDDDWRSRVDELKKRGIRVIGLGVGTAAGAMIPDGGGGFLKDERGAVVLSKLESGTLEELARSTQGTYRNASSWVDLADVLNATVEAGQKGKFTEKNTVRQVERFQWPLAFGVWCLFVSFCYEFPVRARPRELKLGRKTDAGSAKPDKAAAGVAALLLLFVLRHPPSAFAESTAVAPPPLARIVGRLATQERRTAQDWSELARETVTWGQHVQSESHPVPAGPIRDALSAVELGRALDAKATDWGRLNDELKALLQPPESQKQQDQQNQPQNQSNQDQKQQQQDQKNQQQNPPKDQPPKNQSDPQNQSGQSGQPDAQKQPSSPPNQKSSDGRSSPQSENKPDQGPEAPATKPGDGQKLPSAFGDMKDTPPPPPSSSHEMQKVGGVSDQKPGETPASDPSLTIPLQSLEQVRSQDSPAKLFQLMDANKTPPPNKNGKNW